MYPPLKSGFCTLWLWAPVHEIGKKIDILLTRVAGNPIQYEVSRLRLNISELTTDAGRHRISQISPFPRPYPPIVFTYNLYYIIVPYLVHLCHISPNHGSIMEKTLLHQIQIIPWSHQHQKARSHFDTTRDASSPIRAPVFDSHSCSPISFQSLRTGFNPRSALRYSRAHSHWLYIFSVSQINYRWPKCMFHVLEIETGILKIETLMVHLYKMTQTKIII